MPGRDPNPMAYNPRIRNNELRRELVFESLDAVPAGIEFTVRDLWLGRFGSRLPVSFGITYRVIRDALGAGLIETTGRDHTHQGCPRLYRRPR